MREPWLHHLYDSRTIPLLILSFAPLQLMQTFCTDTILAALFLEGP